MDSRKLNRRGLLQRPLETQGTDGQPTPGWENVIAVGDGTVACNVRYLSGVESIKGGAETSVALASLCIRRRAGLTAGMSMVVGGIRYKFNAVLPDEQDKDYVYLPSEVVT